MCGVSSVVACEMSEGEERLVSEGPAALTSVVACERSGTDSATLLICGAALEGPYYQLRLPPGGALAFSDTVALPWGLLVVCQWGDALISLAYR